ncbi:DUF4012 domain-containing protein [Nocardioides mesophilus]|uniref:DUF4012 domain-containing protein n=1 Tax=Nocardioides mesophilus TaxID=433659 RepID=A0A7G9REI6_9ACTN|nr:DUF4012 domain-containing protein [Nocardioides mesophilus]QNN54011.1 DUF4012 domain-containing protein [Nocardioides mesophilus]
MPRQVLVLLALLLLLLLVVTGWQAFSAYRHLTSAAAQMPELRELLLDGDEAELAAGTSALQEDTGAAREALDGPQWALLSAVPGIGDDVDAVRVVTVVVDDLARNAFADVVAARQVVDLADLKPTRGRIELTPLARAAPHLVDAEASVSSAADRLADLDTAGLVDGLRQPVSDLSGKVEDLQGLTAAVAHAAQLLPPMLGAEGPRDYLVLVQNNAEPRALGGIPGAVIKLRADDGRIRLLEQRPASSFGSTEPVLPLTRAEVALYGTQLGRYMQNVTATPDFPRAAHLARAMWRQGTGRRGIDGVLAIDPVALQGLLRATGPVTLPGGVRLTAENTARTLLNTVYREIEDPQAQDRFFAVAAAAIFGKVTSGGIDVPAAADALAAAAKEGRVLVWSANAREQTTIAETAVSGILRGDRKGAPVVGVYLHDRSAAKIAYYEDMDVTVRELRCAVDDGPRTLDVAVTLASNVPRDADRLPDYLTGGGNAVDVGDIRSDLLIYAPTGAVITGVRASDQATPVTTHFHEGLYVAARTFTLDPGKSVTLHYRMAVPRALSGEVRVRSTPGPAKNRFRNTSLVCP